MNLYTKPFIENRINTTFEALNNISHEELHRPHEIYNLTTHTTRYSVLGLGLNVLSLPLVVISGVVKLFSGGMISINNVINLPKILKDKMDQGISKKILYATEGIDKQELADFCNKVLEQWEANPSLVPTQEESYFTKIKNAMYNNIPYLQQIKNFWVKGGINYSEEQTKEQQLIKIITNEIFKLGYSLGKKANYLDIEEIRKYFIDCGAFEDDNQQQLSIDLHNDDFGDPDMSSRGEQATLNMITQIVDSEDEGFEDAFEYYEEYADVEDIEPQPALTTKPIDRILDTDIESFEEDGGISDMDATNTDQKYTGQDQALVLYNDALSKLRLEHSNAVVSNDFTFVTAKNREQVLLNVKKYLTAAIHTNSLLELADGIDLYIESLQDLSNQELGKKIISDYQLLQSNMQDKDIELQNQITQIHHDANILVPYNSCRQEASKDERELEGIVGEG